VIFERQNDGYTEKRSARDEEVNSRELKGAATLDVSAGRPCQSGYGILSRNPGLPAPFKEPIYILHCLTLSPVMPERKNGSGEKKDFLGLFGPARTASAHCMKSLKASRERLDNRVKFSRWQPGGNHLRDGHRPAARDGGEVGALLIAARRCYALL